MLFMIFAILDSVTFGILGFIFRDGVQIIQYTLSSNNLLSDNPVLFTQNDIFVSYIIEECANDDGKFLDTIGDNILSYQEEIDANFEEEIDELNNNECNNDVRDILLELYQSINTGSLKIINTTSNLLDIRCRFSKNDKNIILNELDSAGKRAIVLSAFQFLV